MDSRTLNKLVKDCRLKKIKTVDVDMIFTKCKKRTEKRIDFNEFLDVIGHFAQIAKISPDLFADKIIRNCELNGGGPLLNQTTQPFSVRFYDDKQSYTGVAKQGGPDTGRNPAKVDLKSLLDRSPSDVRGRRIKANGNAHHSPAPPAAVGSSTMVVSERKVQRRTEKSPKPPVPPVARPVPSSATKNLKLRAVFHAADEKNTGWASVEDVGVALLHSRLVSSPREAAAWLKRCNTDIQGRISVEEFIRKRPETARVVPRRKMFSNAYEERKEKKEENENAKRRNIFDKLTDTSLYTGAHKHRFNPDGSGRGKAGRVGLAYHDESAALQLFDKKKKVKLFKPTKTGIFDKLTDPKLYTGTHKHRFDKNGKGRGKAGRDSVPTGTGSMHYADNTGFMGNTNTGTDQVFLDSAQFLTRAMSPAVLGQPCPGQEGHPGDYRPSWK
eukprot:g2006.t1